MKKNLFSTVAVLVSGIFMVAMFSGFKSLNQKKAWNAPDNFKSMKNPVKSDATSIATGKDLWSTHCKSCHGGKGLGDGSKAAQLKTEPGDFSKADIQSQTDGSIFYKITEGRDDMPSFKKKLPDVEDRWALVNFIRTLKK